MKRKPKQNRFINDGLEHMTIGPPTFTPTAEDTKLILDLAELTTYNGYALANALEAAYNAAVAAPTDEAETAAQQELERLGIVGAARTGIILHLTKRGAITQLNPLFPAGDK